MIINNARIYTMSDAGVIENGSIRIENGKIAEISRERMEGADVIDATGKFIFPGLIDGHSHVGMIGDALGFESDDLNEITDPITPQLRAIDAFNPLDRCLKEAAEAGVTCVCVGPGSANPIGGQFALVETVGCRIDNMVLRAPASMKFALGENPKTCYHGKGKMPETRMATAAKIRESLFKAVRYHDDKVKYGTGAKADPPVFDMGLEALEFVVTRKIPAHFHAHRSDDIFTAIRIAKEFNLDYTIVHCTEGHLIAQELAKDGITAFVGPNLTDRSKPELANKTFENPARLFEAGILFGITVDAPVTPLEYLPLCAALAVKSGLPYMEALKAVTCNTAKILKIDGRKGTLKPGMDADIVVCNGDILDVQAKVENVYIEGNRVK